MGEEKPKPYLRLVESLEQSIAALEEEVILDNAPVEGAEILDFEVEKAAQGKTLMARDVSPETVLKLALRDVETFGNVTKCYVTLILDEGDTFTTCNYRAALTRIEEVAFRQLGLTEATDNWRGKGDD